MAAKYILAAGTGKMAAKYILAALAVVFLIAAATRGIQHPQGRTWRLVGLIFAVVSTWLFLSGR